MAVREANKQSKPPVINAYFACAHVEYYPGMEHAVSMPNILRTYEELQNLATYMYERALGRESKGSRETSEAQAEVTNALMFLLIMSNGNIPLTESAAHAIAKYDVLGTAYQAEIVARSIMRIAEIDLGSLPDLIKQINVHSAFPADGSYWVREAVQNLEVQIASELRRKEQMEQAIEIGQQRPVLPLEPETLPDQVHSTEKGKRKLEEEEPQKS